MSLAKPHVLGQLTFALQIAYDGLLYAVCCMCQLFSTVIISSGVS